MFESRVFKRIPLFRKESRARQGIPKHIAITMDDNSAWQKKNRKSSRETFSTRDSVIIDIIRQQVRQNIPIVTLFLLPENRKENDEMESLTNFFRGIQKNQLINKNQVKVSVLGKWYDLPGPLVEEIKHAIDETKNYDRFFLNFCVNYDGQDEIVDACRLIARKIRADKIDIDAINRELIKENLYSSYFLPPDLIIKTGLRRCWSSLLLWDCPGSYYYFPGKVFNDFTGAEMIKAINEYVKSV